MSPRTCEVYMDGEWVAVRASCQCEADVKCVREFEQLSLGPGHQSQPMLQALELSCGACGAKVERIPRKEAAP